MCKCFKWINLFKLLKIVQKKKLNWGTERLINLLKVAQLGFEPWLSWL
jgi:hypothetical protein